MDKAERWLSLAVTCLVALLLFWGFYVARAWAHDPDNPEHHHWYGSLMQPDNPSASCCGLADAYWCDDYFARDGKAYCRITDGRDDKPLGRPHIPIGTEFEIPPYKLKFDRGNPTGHSVIFVNQQGHVWCFVQGVLT